MLLNPILTYFLGFGNDGYTFGNVHQKLCQQDMPCKLVYPMADKQHKTLGIHTMRSTFDVAFGKSNALGSGRVRDGLVLVVVVEACFRQKFLQRNNDIYLFKVDAKKPQ